MKLLKLSVLAATMVLASAALVMLMEIAAIFLGNTLPFSRFVGWVCGLAFLFIFAVNWRSTEKNMGLGLTSSPKEFD